MRLQLLVAVAENGVIGQNNELIWHLPLDLKRFKRLTKGHPIIMGRKTFESIGRPLPGRLNVVLTNSVQEKQKGCAFVNSVESAIETARKNSGKASIIGGESIYRLFADKVDTLHLTIVEGKPEGDAHYAIPTDAEWKCIYRENHEFIARDQPSFRFESYIRR